MAESSFLKKLSETTVLLGDGAMGTELQRLGQTGCPEACNVLCPGIVRDIYRSYLDAGSDIIETNTNGGNRLRLGLHGFANHLWKFNLRGVELARQVCPKGKFVGGSIGPIGGLIEPFGEISRQNASDIFAEQAEVLAECGVDVIFVETMTFLDEAEIAVSAVKRKTGLPVVASLAFEMKNAEPRTAWGNSVAEAVSRLTACGADVLGANCGCDLAQMVVIAEQFRASTTKPIIIQPEAGLWPWTPELIKPHVERLLRLVNILGGCCGVGPEHIRMMNELKQKLKL